jgi:hypothetical protein
MQHVNGRATPGALCALPALAWPFANSLHVFGVPLKERASMDLVRRTKIP